MKRDLSKLLNPQSIAIVGASEKFGAGSLVIENLQTLGYRGKIIPISPKYESVRGYPCYPSLLDVPKETEIDSIAIVLGSKQVIPVLEQAGRRGVGAAWAFASGFAETGKEGQDLQEELRRICTENDILFCGPNCVGYANLHGKVGTYSAPISPTLRKGGVSAIGQSGSVILALANSNRGIGFHMLISSGNEAVLDTTDYLEYLLEDSQTEVIILFLEAVRRPEAFIRACERAAELRKPIIAVKVGRSEMSRKVALTHTAALTGTDRVQEAWFKKLGVIRVEDLDQLLETAEAFSRCRHRLPRGNGVGAITVSGGEIGLIGDLSERLSVTFPNLSSAAQAELRKRLPPFNPIANPLDAWGSGDLTETYPACLEVLAKEEMIDLIAVSQDSPSGMAEKQINQYADVARAAVRTAARGKPIVAFSHVSGGLDPKIRGILESGNVPFLQGTRESLVAIDRLIEYGIFQKGRESKQTVQGKSPRQVEEIIKRLRGPRRVLGDVEAKEILKSYGIPIVAEFLTQSVDEALKAARKIGYPVVLKGQSAEIPHKTEAGLVKLKVRNEEEVRSSFTQILENAQSYKRDAYVEGILLQQMIPSDATEVIVGISQDAALGPMVVFGIGGIFVELLKDTVIRIPPMSQDEARTMISEVKGKDLLEGFRGKVRSDVEALVETLVQVGQMAVDLKEVLISLDLNPLMVLPMEKGVRVVDVVMIVGNT
jgi:acyl-CoA synthetase (NDP forming)